MTATSRPGDGGLLITVAVCTHNRGNMLAGTLRAVAAEQASAPGLSELLVVDSASSDETPRLLDQLALEFPIRTITLDVKGLARARNAALDGAHGLYTVFLDDDAVPTKGWLTELASVIEESASALIAGRVDLSFLSPPASWLRQSTRANALLSALDLGPRARPLTPDEYPVGANMAVRTDAARAVGGFNLKLGRIGRQLLSMEEVDFTDRVRAKSGDEGLWAPLPAVDHHVPDDRTRRTFLLKRAYWQGRSLVRWTRLKAETRPRRPGQSSVRLAAAVRHLALVARPDGKTTVMDHLLDASYELGRAVGWIERLSGPGATAIERS
jgi:glycosyltransferase involved in cell wall biosynthesis